MQTGRALHKKRSLVSQPPPPQWFLDFLSSQKELSRGDQYPLGRCPKCKRTDTVSSPSHDYGRAECVSCGYAGSKNEFIIDDVVDRMFERVPELFEEPVGEIGLTYPSEDELQEFSEEEA